MQLHHIQEDRNKTTYKISRSRDKTRIEFSRSLSHKKFQIVEQKEATIKRILLLRELNLLNEAIASETTQENFTVRNEHIGRH